MLVECLGMAIVPSDFDVSAQASGCFCSVPCAATVGNLSHP